MSKMEVPELWGPREQWRILKNVVVLSLAFMVQYTSYNGALNLQSSINADAGLGTASMAAMSASVLFSNLFLPVVLIRWLTSKWTVMFCFTLFVPYIVGQLWPTFYTLIPMGILAGLGCAPVWCAMCTYIATLAEAHSKISSISMDALLSRYLGLFFMIYQINQVWGNIISSIVLSTGDNKAAVTSMNATLIPELCGANFLPSADAGKALQHQPPEKIQMLVGIYVALMIAAMIIVAFGIDSPLRYKSSETNNGSGQSLLLVTLKLIIEPNQMLLIIISIFIGLQQAFVTADLTVAFVSCAIGPGTVGYFMLAYGLADAFGCAITGYLAKLIGRCKLISCALILNLTLFVILMVWKPQANVVHMHYVVAVLFGICNSVFLVQINAYYGILFKGREEPAFASFRLFEAIGFTIVNGISAYLKTITKIYILFVSLVLGVSGYLIVEFKESRLKANNVDDSIDISNSKGFDNRAYNKE